MALRLILVNIFRYVLTSFFYIIVFVIILGIAGREPENQGGDEEPIPTFTWPPEPSPALVSGDEEGNAKNPSGAASVSEPHKRRANSLSALRAIFDCPAVSPHIRQLLSTK